MNLLPKNIEMSKDSETVSVCTSRFFYVPTQSFGEIEHVFLACVKKDLFYISI
jgi:hypothetical protein